MQDSQTLAHSQVENAHAAFDRQQFLDVALHRLVSTDFNPLQSLSTSAGEVGIVGNMAYVKTDIKQLLFTILYNIIAWYAGQGSMSCLLHALTLYRYGI